MQNYITSLHTVAQVHTAVVFRDQPPQEDSAGNVRALAIRDLVSSKPLKWTELPRVAVDDKYVANCLQRGDVVLPGRGDYYKAWMFDGADKPVLPIGQVHIIRPSEYLNPDYLVWYLNQSATQAKIFLMLTGTSIKALTKTSLVSLEIEIPEQHRQRGIADLDRMTRQIAAIRHRISELDSAEINQVTRRLLHRGDIHA